MIRSVAATPPRTIRAGAAVGAATRRISGQSGQHHAEKTRRRPADAKTKDPPRTIRGGHGKTIARRPRVRLDEGLAPSIYQIERGRARALDRRRQRARGGLQALEAREEARLWISVAAFEEASEEARGVAAGAPRASDQGRRRVAAPASSSSASRASSAGASGGTSSVGGSIMPSPSASSMLSLDSSLFNQLS